MTGAIAPATFDERLLRRLLGERFGHEQFRPGQIEVLRAVFAGQPTLAVMPTGAGKSLCFQLPALVLPGLTLVVSPLIALMKDQVHRLRERRIAAACLNGTQSEAERVAVERDLIEGRLRLLYIAPERFRSTSFRRALAHVDVALVAVDEAHCISEWGHSFRPDFERLGEAIADLGATRLLALTATATRDVRADIVRALRMQHPIVIARGFDRPNVHLEVHALGGEREKREAIVRAVREHHPAIIYSATRKQAEALARVLALRGARAAAYHGGLEGGERHRVQARFSDGELDVIAATNAFGLGIDKRDVRLVIHSELPRSVEAYCQELGRAGRDGGDAIAALTLLEGDVFLQRRLLSIATPSPTLVEDLADRLFTSRAPAPVHQLAGDLAGVAKEQQVLAALAFLESAGVVERQYTSDREHPAGAMAYAAVPDHPLAAEDLLRLRRRSFRDRQRLEHMVTLARRRTCRRAALLRELGEPPAAVPCGACDVCGGARLAVMRAVGAPSGLRAGPAWAMSGSAAKVPGSIAKQRALEAPAGRG